MTRLGLSDLSYKKKNAGVEAIAAATGLISRSSPFVFGLMGFQQQAGMKVVPQIPPADSLR